MKEKMSKKKSWNTILVFCILIYGFTLATLIKPAEEFSQTENRPLQQMPRASAETVLNGEFEADYETYLTDQFVLRDGWIGLKTAAERAALKRESKDIYFAEDGYLIEKHTGAFTSETSSRNIRVLSQFVQQYREQFKEGHMTVMIVPNAVDILRGLLPPFAAPYDEEAYLASVREALPAGVWFDAASVLRDHTDEQLYYRTDHHWTTRAAFYVYQAWAAAHGLNVPEHSDYTVETVTEEFEGTIQSKLGIQTGGEAIELYYPKEDIFYSVQKNGSPEISYSIYDYTALDTKDKYAVYFGGNHALVQLKTRSDSGRKLLMIKDSYAHCFAPFLLEEFETIDLLDIRYYNQKVSELIAENGYTDVLFLYNAAGFAEDTSIAKLLG